MGAGDNPKRRSLLFPFAKSTPKETKFEVVNRKKNPAANLNRPSAPSPFDSQPSRPPEKRASSPSPASSASMLASSASRAKSPPASTTSPRSTSPHHIPLDPRAINPFKAHHHTSSLKKDAISQADLPSSNLDVNFNVPPVPDYNSTLHAPPVTIKGRTVSLTKKDAPPRRKPPTLGTVVDPQINNKSVSDLSIQSAGSDSYSYQSSGLDSRLANDQANARSVEETTLEDDDENVLLPTIQKPEPAAPPSIVVTEELLSAVPKDTEDEELEQVEQKTADLKLSEPLDEEPEVPAKIETQVEELDDIETSSIQDEPELNSKPIAPFSDPSKNTSQVDSFTSASEFMDTEQVEQVPKVEPKNETQYDDDPDSSFEIKPLFFHKKSKSSASEGALRNDASIFTTEGVVTSPKPTHAKQLSLSDDILKDIEDFQSAIPSHVQDETDEVSPVSPLALQKDTRPTIARTGLYDEISEDEDYSFEPDVPQRQLVVQNPDSEIEDTNESLFQDSSDESHQPGNYNAFDDKEELKQSESYDYDHVGGMNLGSRGSSVQPEIDYHDNDNNAPKSDHQRIPLTDDETGEEEESSKGYENEFNKFADEAPDTSSYEGRLAIPRSHSYHNIPSDVASHNEKESYNSNTGSSPLKSTTSEEDGDKLTFERRSVGNASSDQASSYNYYSQAAQTRKFHVVNTGDYSDEDQSSYNPSFDRDHPESLDHDFSVVHQQITNSSDRGRDTDEEDLLSFTAKSPQQTDFNFENKTTPQQMMGNNVSDVDLSQPAKITPVSNLDSPTSITSPVNSYDRREDTVAPVQYVSTYNGSSRRPPPLSDAPKTTRVARSLSTSVPPPVNYNTLQEGIAAAEAIHPVETHEPEKSSYVEMLRMSSGTANSDVPASVWGLPIGIADIDHSKLTATASRTAYKRAQRTSKSDLKHGKIKPRLLASEVDDDDSTEMVSGIESQSIDLDKSRTPSIHSPTQSYLNFSPTRTPTNTGVSRSGTLIGDKIGTQLGRSGSVMSTVKPVNNMTLFIANPDIEEDD